MSHKNSLSVAFNMSLGFIPVIISMILCEFIAQNIAIYIGAGTGLAYSYFIMYRSKLRIQNFILYLSTAILLILSLVTLFPLNYCPKGNLPITLEMSIIIPLFILFLHKRRFINFFLKRKDACDKQNFVQSAETTIVSVRVALIFAAIHFTIIALNILIAYPLWPTSFFFLLHVGSPLVFIVSILFNQLGINYFNTIMSNLEHVPIVNEKGDVIGKSLKIEATKYKNAYINPVIRIALASHNMLFLCNRSQDCILDKGRIDIPLECYLRYDETLEEGVERLIKHVFPTTEIVPSFSITYHFENSITNRLIYLFVANIENDAILCDKRFKNGKLWTFQQIQQNMTGNYFCECLKLEYDHLKEIIYIKGKYKES
ncbi:hypothetical protein [uncultured Bacteroides sp.]|uniref:hypothetical protein n=1 Tax=uncultured Bacteroides sp. TaxID=162156 RepID=UPI002AA92AF8|nr:hypothetical protein [uncultured Bacteroides sp.]